MRRTVTLSWILAAFAALLLGLSLAGDGTGPFGGGVFLSMIWSYVLLLGGVAFGLWVAAGRRREKKNEETA